MEVIYMSAEFKNYIFKKESNISTQCWRHQSKMECQKEWTN